MMSLGLQRLFYCIKISEMKQFLISIWEILETVIIAAVTVFLIRTYLVQPFLVSGASMEPNVDNGNYLIIDELSKQFKEFERGDIVVFRYPGDLKTFYIKRIIGLSGERVRISGGDIYDNNERLEENYLPEGTRTFGNVDLVVGPDEYFVLGDNRDNSFDSRSWGPLVKENITGIARLRLFPIQDITVFDRPLYVTN